MSHRFCTYWAIILLVSLFSCNRKKEPEIPQHRLTGKFGGVDYEIVYIGDTLNYQAQADSIYQHINSTFSIHVDNSLVSRINQYNRTDSLFRFNDSTGIFVGIYDQVKDVWRKSGGFYDPTIRPLIRAWAGVNAGISTSEPNLDSLFQFVGFDESNFDVIEQFDEARYLETHIRKRDPRTEIDFGKALFAYSLDHIVYFLKEKGISQYRVKIGNCLSAGGITRDTLTTVQLHLPDTLEAEQLDILNMSFAYKNKTDKHSMIDGTYGYPVENNIEYVATLAPSAVQAEAYAQAFMIMGVEEVERFYTNYPDETVEALIIYRENGELRFATTDGFDGRIVKPEIE